MRRSSLPSRAETSLWELGKGEPVHVNVVTEHLGLATTDRRRVRVALGDLVKGSRAEKMGAGRWRPLKREPGQPEKKEIMFRYLRARRVVTREGLMQAADASAPTVRDWLGSYIRLGLVVNEAGKGKPGRYRLVKDPVAMPADDLGEVQRRKRELKKEALGKLDKLYADAIDLAQTAAEARLAVSQLEEG